MGLQVALLLAVPKLRVNPQHATPGCIYKQDSTNMQTW